MIAIILRYFVEMFHRGQNIDENHFVNAESEIVVSNGKTCPPPCINHIFIRALPRPLFAISQESSNVIRQERALIIIELQLLFVHKIEKGVDIAFVVLASITLHRDVAVVDNPLLEKIMCCDNRKLEMRRPAGDGIPDDAFD